MAPSWRLTEFYLRPVHHSDEPVADCDDDVTRPQAGLVGGTVRLDGAQHEGQTVLVTEGK